VNPVCHIVDDTKGKDARCRAGLAGVKPGVAMEKPEVVMAKIHQQATSLGPVMEEILRVTQQCGQSHWGLNE
jgi:hypothetical protein